MNRHWLLWCLQVSKHWWRRGCGAEKDGGEVVDEVIGEAGGGKEEEEGVVKA